MLKRRVSVLHNRYYNHERELSGAGMLTFGFPSDLKHLHSRFLPVGTILQALLPLTLGTHRQLVVIAQSLPGATGSASFDDERTTATVLKPRPFTRTTGTDRRAGLLQEPVAVVAARCKFDDESTAASLPKPRSFIRTTDRRAGLFREPVAAVAGAGSDDESRGVRFTTRGPFKLFLA